MHKFVFVAASAALMTSTAMAADLGVVQHSAPVVYEAPADWTGFYAGVFGGAASFNDFNLNFGPTGGPGVIDLGVSGGGMFGGAQIGADFQFNNFVIGAVADIALTNAEASIDFSIPTIPVSGEITSRLTHLGTVRARAGYLPTDDLLIYAHGGLAYAGTEQTASITAPGGGISVDDFTDPNHWGYTVGAGVEFAVTENISILTEYAYTDLGDQTIYSTGGTDIVQSLDMHTVKAGLNFRF